MSPILNDYERGEYINTLWKSYRAGKIDADQMLIRQNEVMPVCDFCHSEHSVGWVPDGYICSSCYIAQSKDTPDVRS